MATFKDQLKELLNQLKKEVKDARTIDELEEISLKYLGKKNSKIKK